MYWYICDFTMRETYTCGINMLSYLMGFSVFNISFNNISALSVVYIYIYIFLRGIFSINKLTDINRSTAVMKVETYFITYIAASPIRRDVIRTIMSLSTLTKTASIFFRFDFETAPTVVFFQFYHSACSTIQTCRAFMVWSFSHSCWIYN